jgi:hypothetical protein
LEDLFRGSLGKIEDIVIDADAGRIAYAVLSFGGFLGMGDKYFAIPWEALRFNPFNETDKHIVLNVDKKLLDNAPGFNKDNWLIWLTNRGVIRYLPTMVTSPIGINDNRRG